MTHMLAFDLESAFRSITARMEEEGIFTREAYYDLVEEFLEAKRGVGELSDDDEIEEFEDVLRKRWPEAEELFTTGHENDILDQE